VPSEQARWPLAVPALKGLSIASPVPTQTSLSWRSARRDDDSDGLIVRCGACVATTGAPLASTKVETPAERFNRLIGALEGEPNTRQRRRCSGITRKGERCTAWALKDDDLCAGHTGIGIDAARSTRSEQAKARREDRLSVRERAAAALDDDLPAVLAALRRGLNDPHDRKAAQTAI
jgi:hypothetical protein